MNSSFDEIAGPLSAALAPMGRKTQDALLSCLPDALSGPVNARLSHIPEAGDGTDLERSLRAQAEVWWGEGGEKSEITSQSLDTPLRGYSGRTEPDALSSSQWLRIEGQKSGDALALEDVLALVLRRARPTTLTRALSQMSDLHSAAVLYRIAALDLSRVSHRIEGDEAGVFFWGLREALGEVRLKPSPELAAGAIRAMAPHLARRVLTALHRIDPGAMKAVQGLAYPFEDLMQLSGPELQMALMGVENRDVALALQVTPMVVRNRISEGLSSRRQKVVEEEQALAGEVSEEIARRAQSRIVDRARLLYESGQLHTYFGSIEDTEALVRARQETREAVYNKHMAWVKALAGRARQGRSQSVGVALAAALLLAFGMLFLSRLRATHEPGQEPEAVGRAPRGRTSSTPLPERGKGRKGAEGAGLRVDLASGGEGSVELIGLSSISPEKRKGVRLRRGTARVVVVDTTAVLETPSARITGGAGAAYRVRVGADAVTRLTALRGDLQASPTRGKAVRVGTGQQAVFLPDGETRVTAGVADAEDLAWLEKNR